jgi:exodeoxyribonuclease V alpha subunit
MTETCGVEAQTIHRLLEIAGGGLSELDNEKRNASSSLGMHFNRDQDNPLEADVIIVDEMSMVDI